MMEKTKKLVDDIDRGISRRIWDLQRFGLTPHKVRARLENRDGPKILIVSIPKAGTHLVERALCLHQKLYRKLTPTLNVHNVDKWGGFECLLRSLRSGQILVSHFPYSAGKWELIRSSGVKCLFIIRDPRDIVVSQAFYVAKNRRHNFHYLFRDVELEKRIRLAIGGDGSAGYPSILETLTRFRGWMDTDCAVVRFEDLVDKGKSYRTLDLLYRQLGMKLEKDQLSYINSNLISVASPTFRKGSTGQWRSHFDETIKGFFMETVKEALSWYGYN